MPVNVLSEQVEMISLLSSGDAAFMANNPRGIKKEAKQVKTLCIIKVMCHKNYSE